MSDESDRPRIVENEVDFSNQGSSETRNKDAVEDSAGGEGLEINR